jgi:hypothetical protein
VRRAASATALILSGVQALGVSACGGGAGQSSPTTTEASTTRAATPPDHHQAQAPKDEPKGGNRKSSGHEAPKHHPVKAAVSETKPARLDPAQLRAAAVVRAYVGALDAGDGQRACALFVPGALNEVKFPRDRGDCASSLEASIGYRDPRGFPVYKGSRVARIASVKIDGADARVVATVVTDFAGNREPSIEDDVVYLHQRGGNWLIVKPSAALYRAIGVGDIPPTVLAPPK